MKKEKKKNEKVRKKGIGVLSGMCDGINGGNSNGTGYSTGCDKEYDTL